MKLKKLLVPVFVVAASVSTTANATGYYEYGGYPEQGDTTVTNNNHLQSNSHLHNNTEATGIGMGQAYSGSDAAANADAHVGPITNENGSHASISQEIGGNQNHQTVGLTTGEHVQTVGDNTQTNNQALSVDSSGQSVNYHNETKVGAITGAPNLGSQYITGECKDGWGFSIGGGTPFSGSGGIGLQKTNKDDECIREGREHQIKMQGASIEHVERVETIRAGSNENVARIQGATHISVTGMKHLCNLAFNENAPKTQATTAEHGACERNTTQAMDFLFPGSKAPATQHKH